MTVRIPKEAMELMKEFESNNPDSIYLFPILHRQGTKKRRTGKVKKIRNCIWIIFGLFVTSI